MRSLWKNTYLILVNLKITNKSREEINFNILESECKIFLRKNIIILFQSTL